MTDEARALPSRSHGWLRTWFRNIWDVRGGGLYACGFALSFLWYELGSLIDDIADIGMLFDGRIMEFVVGVAVDFFRNTIAAFIWPAYVVKFAQPWGAVALGLAFWLFPVYAKPHIEAWLFDENAPREKEKEE